MKIMQQLLYAFLGISFLFLMSCKDSDRDDDKTTTTSADYAMVQSMAMDIFKTIHQAALSSKGISANNLATSTSIFGCDTLIVDTTVTPMQLTLVFDSCNINGILKTGQLMAAFSSKYDVPSATTTISFLDYTHNNMLFSGSITVTNNGMFNGNPTYGLSATNLKVEEGRKNRNVFWNANQSITQTVGATTADFTDDRFTIVGISNGRAFAGNAFTTTTDSLHYAGNCNWVESGIATVSPENLTVRTLDFGSTCDNKAWVSFFGNKTEILFP